MRSVLLACRDIARREFDIERYQDGKYIKRKFYHWSFVINHRYHIIDWAINRPDFSDELTRFGYRLKRHTIHAEVAAYRKAHRHSEFDRRKPWFMVNIRLLSNGADGHSAPCWICLNFLHANGCAACWYTTGDGGWKRFNLGKELLYTSTVRAAYAPD